jgi:catechol 2,3-dioxygenase-like lactoylglutathione lyase family enzyme
LSDIDLTNKEGKMIRIRVTSIFVNDQEKALAFYTEKLGFVKQQDVPAGDYRWLTVASSAEPDGVQLLLEPNAHPAAKAYQAAIHADGIPATAFEVDDLDAEIARLTGLGVTFKGPPADYGVVRVAVLDDTCGNWIQLTDT